jgi:hypothetical protein
MVTNDQGLRTKLARWSPLGQYVRQVYDSSRNGKISYGSNGTRAMTMSTTTFGITTLSIRAFNITTLGITFK